MLLPKGPKSTKIKKVSMLLTSLLPPAANKNPKNPNRLISNKVVGATAGLPYYFQKLILCQGPQEGHTPVLELLPHYSNRAVIGQL